MQYLDMLVMRKMDKVAYRLAEALGRAGYPTFVTAARETDWTYRRASYKRLSTRHLGVEAGLGTLGLEVNILTPGFGPRIYLTGILTELELEPDARSAEQVCIGESCSRCLHSCPADAVLHWGIDKRACASPAQEFGFSTMLGISERLFARPGPRPRSFARAISGCQRGMLAGSEPRATGASSPGPCRHSGSASSSAPKRSRRSAEEGDVIEAIRACRAEALSKPMLGLIERNAPEFARAHPLSWAPYALVGNGGRCSRSHPTDPRAARS